MSDEVKPERRGADVFSNTNVSPFMRWIIGQDSTVVVLIGFIALLAYGANRVVTELVPKHLEQIQSGYERAIMQQNETVHNLTEAQAEKVKMITDAFTKEQERAEKRYESIESRYEKALDRLDPLPVRPEG